MPEYPDVKVYCQALQRVVVGQCLQELDLQHPFLLRSVEPKLESFHGKRLTGVRREAKQIILVFEDQSKLLIHLMIAGRLRWRAKGSKIPKANLVALLHFEQGTVMFTEAGKKRRARLYALGPEEEAISPFRKGGLDVFECDAEAFERRLKLRNHTLRRALTDQRLFSGIGNAYSDEILFHARLSPLKQTHKLTGQESLRLYESCREVLSEWVERLSNEVGEGFPDRVTAFHPDMTTHGRYQAPCRVCSAPIQRIRYASNETNYCPNCQNEGRLLADRSLSRLLKSDWPKSVDELEDHIESRRK